MFVQQRAAGPPQLLPVLLVLGTGLGDTQLGVQHEQRAEVVGILGWSQLERPPETGDPIEPLAAELALGTKVDRGVRGAPSTKTLVCSAPVGTGSPTARQTAALRGGGVRATAPRARTSSPPVRTRRRCQPGDTQIGCGAHGCTTSLITNASARRLERPQQPVRPPRAVGRDAVAGRPRQRQPRR